MSFPLKSDLKKENSCSERFLPRPIPLSPIPLNTQPPGHHQHTQQEVPRSPGPLLLNPILPKVTQRGRGDPPRYPDFFHGFFEGTAGP